MRAAASASAIIADRGFTSARLCFARLARNVSRCFLAWLLLTLLCQRQWGVAQRPSTCLDAQFCLFLVDLHCNCRVVFYFRSELITRKLYALTLLTLSVCAHVCVSVYVCCCVAREISNIFCGTLKNCIGKRELIATTEQISRELNEGRQGKRERYRDRE